jgi:hypothetical protein
MPKIYLHKMRIVACNVACPSPLCFGDNHDIRTKGVMGFGTCISLLFVQRLDDNISGR